MFYPLEVEISLNIKNIETCQLASEVAHLTGETMTGATTVAAKQRLEREKRERSLEARIQDLHTIGHRTTICAAVARRAFSH